MPSPISSDDFSPINWQGDACTQFGELFKTNERLNQFLAWLLGSNGELSDAVLDGIADRISPVGTLQQYGGVTPPSDRYLFANGQAVSRVAYPVLFSRYGITFGSGDGSTTFNLPNVTNRMLVGSSGTYPMGVTGGEETHTLLENEMPAHTHAISGTFHAANNDSGGGAVDGGNFSGTPKAIGEDPLYMTLTAGSTGGGEAHNNMPPYLSMPAIIRVK